MRTLHNWRTNMRIFAILILLGATLEAQVTWTATPFIAGRNSHAMAYDAARGRVVLFSGLSAQRLADTWEWDGGRWSQMKPATSPPFRSGHAMAYDPVRRRVVLFGGSDRSVPCMPIASTTDLLLIVSPLATAISKFGCAPEIAVTSLS